MRNVALGADVCNAARCVIRDSNLGHKLLLPPANWRSHVCVSGHVQSLHVLARLHTGHPTLLPAPEGNVKSGSYSRQLKWPVEPSLDPDAALNAAWARRAGWFLICPARRGYFCCRCSRQYLSHCHLSQRVPGSCCCLALRNRPDGGGACGDAGQALKCNTNKCPTGVATQDPDLMTGLDPTDKACAPGTKEI